MSPNLWVKLTVEQDQNGDCAVLEHNPDWGEPTVIARFPAATRTLTVVGQYGPELAIRDMAKIRAEIFCQFMEKIINSPEFDL